MILTLDYLKYHSEYANKYGDKTLVLMQVGSFFECYATNEKGPELQSISYILNIILTKKDKSILETSEKNPKMLGFPCVSLQKNLKILTENSYTVIVIEQVTNPPNPKREITGIYSPSTYIEEVQSDNNYLLSIFISEEKQLNGKYFNCIGVTALDLNIGKTIIEEYHSSVIDENLAINKLYESLNKFSPKEIIIYSQNKIDLDKYNHRYLTVLDKEYFKLPYQTKFFQKIYGEIGIINILEYLGVERKPFATISLMMALDFCYTQNEKLLKNISKPVINENDKLFMGNNTLLNLNVISNEKDKRINSLFDVINQTSTILGKRLLKERLLNPEIDIDLIQKRYDETEKYLKNDLFLQIKSILLNIKDIERYSRRIVIKSLHPAELFNLYVSIKNCDLLYKLLNLEQTEELQLFLKFIEYTFNLEVLEKTYLRDLNNFYNPGIHKELDKIVNKINFGEDLVEYLIKTLNGIAREDLKFSVKNNKKEGQFIVLTKKKGDKLLSFLKEWEEIEIKDNIKINVKDLEFSSTKTSTKIKIPKLAESHTDANTLQNMINNKIKSVYLVDLEKINKNWNNLFKDCIKLVSEIDCVVSNCLCVVKYNYCRPEIKNETSFIHFENLRHPIIERLIDYEYVPQSLEIGKNLKGILLYGLNSSGKSSFQKSIGLSIIMAQTGLYVPATKFSFAPYRYIFTRIDGNDNLFKGLSSFTLEMMDLKNILKYRGENTLIIGDEVCKGTEYLSANSILASTIISLSKSQTSFIFATHLHEIPKIEMIKELQNVKCYHLDVKHNSINNELIFERILKEGQGEEIYGILVSNNIINDTDFNELTNNIKNELLKKPNMILQNKKSRYNSQVYIDECELCKKRVVDEEYDVHHINFQKDCENGFVKDKPHIPKNGKMNLMVLCEECHQKIHKGEICIQKKIQSSKKI